MASPKERLDELRRRRPLVDHVLRMNEQYGATKAGQQAGAVTYFGFLSFFPILALAFFVIGLVSQIYPGANRNLADAINAVLPGLIGSGKNQISLSTVRTFSGLAGLIGVVGVLYSGLSWISALRDALTAVFETPRREQPSFVKGKLRDLLTLSVIGLVLVVSVAVTGFVGGFSDKVLGWVGLGSQLGWLVQVLVIVLGLASNAVLFYAMFRLLAEPHVSNRSLWSGALLGTIGFELLKQASRYLIQAISGQQAAAAFGTALILIVWINYFSRLVLYSAAWAYTTREAREQRVEEPAAPVQGPVTPSLVDHALGRQPPSEDSARPWLAPFAAGGATALALVAVLRKKDS